MLFINCSLFNDDEDNLAPFDCDTTIPQTGQVTFELTLDELNPEVKVELYIGKIDNGLLVDTFTTSLETTTKYYPNDNYSALAKYQYIHEGTLIELKVVDEDDLQYSSETYSDKTCYEIGSINLDLSLNHIKD